MKAIILGAIGAFMIVYTVITGLGVYNTDTRYEEMENALSQVIKQTLEANYGKQTTEERKEQLVADIKYRMGSDSDVEVVIHSMNLQKGIISVTVKESFTQLNGQRKQLEWQKTAIVDFSLIRYLTEEEIPKKALQIEEIQIEEMQIEEMQTEKMWIEKEQITEGICGEEVYEKC